MAKIDVKCLGCGRTDVVRNGKNSNGVQRYLCQNEDCPIKTFMLEYAYNGWKPDIEERIIKMTANASGIRDISRILEISQIKVMSTLKKQNHQ